MISGILYIDIPSVVTYLYQFFMILVIAFSRFSMCLVCLIWINKTEYIILYINDCYYSYNFDCF